MFRILTLNMSIRLCHNPSPRSGSGSSLCGVSFILDFLLFLDFFRDWVGF
jgi:hypothetical protein